jgi:HSP20 family molecular chaperone IbpA
MGFNFFKSHPEIETDSWLDDFERTPLEAALSQLEDVEDAASNVQEEFKEIEHFELPVDAYYQNDYFVIKTPVIGASEDQVAITVNGQDLTIHKQATMDHTAKGADYIYEECHWGSLSRTITLPESINAEKAKAKIEHGVLTITLPLTESVQTKIIKIK